MRDQFENVLNVETALHNDLEFLLMLVYLSKTSKSCNRLLSLEKKTELEGLIYKRLLDEPAGLEYMMTNFDL